MLLKKNHIINKFIGNKIIVEIFMKCIKKDIVNYILEKKVHPMLIGKHIIVI